MKKRWTFLAAALIVLMLPLNAFASQNAKDVGSSTALILALKPSNGEATLSLSKSFNVTRDLTVEAGTQITLDLNGKTLDLNGNMFIVDGLLKILDSEGGGMICADDIAVKLDGGSFILESGCISSDGDTAVRIQGGLVNISGGRIETQPGSAAIMTVSPQIPADITIGERGGSHDTIYISGISASEKCSLNIFAGIVGCIDNVGSSAVLECLFEQDVSDALGDVWTCEQVEYAGKLYYSAAVFDKSDAQARIGDKYFADAASAAHELGDGETLVLLKDVSANEPGKAILDIDAADITVELNGCDITNTGTEGVGIAVSAGSAASARIVNSGSPVNITAALPLSFSGTALTAGIQGQIELRSTAGAPVKLDNALLEYSDDAADAIANGGFAAEVDGDMFIFTDAGGAAALSDDGSALLLNDYSGTEQIAVNSGTAHIDLDGHTYAVSGDMAVSASGTGARLTVTDGQIVGDARAQLGASLELDDIDLAGEVSASGDGTQLALTGCAIEDTGVGVDLNAAGGSLNMYDCSISASPALRVAAGAAYISGDSELRARGNAAAVSAFGGSIIIYSGIFVGGAADAIHVAGTSTQLAVCGGSFSSPVSMSSVTAGLDAVCCSADGMYSYYCDLSAAETADFDGVAIDISTASGAMCSVTFDGSSLSGLPDSISIQAGAAIKLPEAEREGLFFTGWYDGEEIHKPGELLTISADTVLTAVWSETDPDLLAITIVEPEHGSLSADVESAHAGDTVTVTAEPDDGYVLEHITLDGEPIEGSTFEMPDHEVELSATFTIEHLTFDDVKPWEWYYECIGFVCENGLMNGVSASEFDPSGTMTRAMFWTVLARMEGVDTDGGETWFSNAQRWAMLTGVSDGTMPGELITREQLATMLWRYMGEPTPGGSLAAFSDAGSVSDWARDAFAWAVGEGIVNGVTESTLAPQESATRAQAAAIFMRCVEAAT